MTTDHDTKNDPAREQFRIVCYTLALVAGHTRPDAEVIADDIVGRFGGYPATVENTAAIIDAVHQWVPADVFAPPPLTEPKRYGPTETEADEARQALIALTDAADEAARLEARSVELAGTEGDPFPGDFVGDRHREFTDAGDALAAFPAGTTEADALDPGDPRYARHAAGEPDAVAERATMPDADAPGGRVDAKHVDSVADQQPGDFPGDPLDPARPDPNFSRDIDGAEQFDPIEATEARAAEARDDPDSRPAEVVGYADDAATMPDADVAGGRVPATGEPDYADDAGIPGDRRT